MSDYPSVYVETSVISYLTSRPSRDIITLANQQITEQWWEQCAPHFRLFVSAIVEVEAGGGDPVAAVRRMAIVNTLPYLAITDEVEVLSLQLLKLLQLPARAERDALHIACASVHRADYLLTWNMKHIANAASRTHIEKLLGSLGCAVPVICTPFELLSTTESRNNDDTF